MAVQERLGAVRRTQVREEAAFLLRQAGEGDREKRGGGGHGLEDYRQPPHTPPSCFAEFPSRVPLRPTREDVIAH